VCALILEKKTTVSSGLHLMNHVKKLFYAALIIIDVFFQDWWVFKVYSFILTVNLELSRRTVLALLAGTSFNKLEFKKLTRNY